MQLTVKILLGLTILAGAFTLAPDRMKPARFRGLNWGQKLLGAIAIIVAVVVILNPEFLALGLLGDTAFFDLLVLLISIQMQAVVARIWCWISTVFSAVMRWVIMPTPRMSYLVVVWTLAAFGSVVSTLQKVVHRIGS